MYISIVNEDELPPDDVSWSWKEVQSYAAESQWFLWQPIRFRVRSQLENPRTDGFSST